MGIFPNFRCENKTSLKPPPSFYLFNNFQLLNGWPPKTALGEPPRCIAVTLVGPEPEQFYP